MWQQDLSMIRVDRLIAELNKGNLENRLDSWMNFYKEYYRIGFTPYIV